MKCPYCGSDTELKDSAVIYNGKSYGMVWVCSRFPACNSYVGCHKGTTKPLGIPANLELRNARSLAHKLLDSMWLFRAINEDISDSKARSDAYAWLAAAMKLDPADCHIGMFDLEQCRRVVDLVGGRKA